MKLKKWEAALIAAALLTVFFGSAIDSEAAELSKKLIRLHVVADSDSEEDQKLKLKVRDSILYLLEDRLSGITDKEEAEKIIEESLADIVSAAEETVRQNGYNYEVTAQVLFESFPTTEYDTFSLPAGMYMSLRVKIGEAAGRNWWCVVFPPVCSVATIDKTTAAAIGLTEDEISLITSGSEGFAVKFRIMELLGKLRSVFK